MIWPAALLIVAQLTDWATAAPHKELNPLVIGMLENNTALLAKILLLTVIILTTAVVQRTRRYRAVGYAPLWLGIVAGFFGAWSNGG